MNIYFYIPPWGITFLQTGRWKLDFYLFSQIMEKLKSEIWWTYYRSKYELANNNAYSCCIYLSKCEQHMR